MFQNIQNEVRVTAIRTETAQIETLKSQCKLFVMLARKFWESTLHTVTWTGFHTLNFPVTDTYQNCLIYKQNFFWQMDQSGCLTTSCITKGKILY